MINKDLIGNRGKLKKIEIPEWGGSCYIKKLNCKDMETVIKSVDKERKDEDIQPLLLTIILALTDEHLNPIFNISEINSLEEEEFSIITNIYKEIVDFNNLTIDIAKKN